MDRDLIINESKRIVIKIGTNALSKKDGTLNNKIFNDYAKEISSLHKEKKQVILVSSGAIGAGVGLLKLNTKPRNIELRQACAALGQNELMNNWSQALAKYNIKVAQVLLTYDVFSTRKLYLNLKNSIQKLLSLNIIPIINENDVIAIDEIGIAFGDNDKMSAMVASEMQADILVIATDVEGVYSKNPKTNKDAKVIDTIFDISTDLKRACGGKGSSCGTGGMISKLDAAKIAMDSGITMFIVKGSTNIKKLFDLSRVGTMFIPKRKLTNKKSWIKIAKSSGEIYVDGGAKNAILDGKNLLSAGITEVKGNFNMNDVISIFNENKRFAKAIIDLSSEEMDKIKGSNSLIAKELLGKSCKNIFRRENLVIL